MPIQQLVNIGIVNENIALSIVEGGFSLKAFGCIDATGSWLVMNASLGSSFVFTGSSRRD